MDFLNIHYSFTLSYSCEAYNQSKNHQKTSRRQSHQKKKRPKGKSFAIERKYIYRIFSFAIKREYFHGTLVTNKGKTCVGCSQTKKSHCHRLIIYNQFHFHYISLKLAVGLIVKIHSKNLLN